MSEARKADPPKPVTPETVPWSPVIAFLVAALIFVGGQVGVGFLLWLYPLSRHWSMARADSWLNGTYVQFVYFLVVEALTFGALWWFIRWRKSSLAAIGWRRLRPVHIVYALAGYGVYFLIYTIVLSMAHGLIPALNIQQHQDIGFQATTGFWELVVTFISLVVLPPLIEETLFRGFLFTTFRKKMPFVLTALIVSILFGSLHLLESSGGGLLWVGGLDTFTLSIVLCYLREKSGNLWPGVFLHALKNGIAFFVLFIAPLVRWHFGL